MLGGAAEEKAASIEIHSKLHKRALDEIVLNQVCDGRDEECEEPVQDGKEQIEDKGATINILLREVWDKSRDLREDSAQMTSDTKSIQSATTSMSSSLKKTPAACEEGRHACDRVAKDGQGCREQPEEVGQSQCARGRQIFCGIRFFNQLQSMDSANFRNAQQHWMLLSLKTKTRGVCQGCCLASEKVEEVFSVEDECRQGLQSFAATHGKGGRKRLQATKEHERAAGAGESLRSTIQDFHTIAEKDEPAGPRRSRTILPRKTLCPAGPMQSSLRKLLSQSRAALERKSMILASLWRQGSMLLLLKRKQLLPARTWLRSLTMMMVAVCLERRRRVERQMWRMLRRTQSPASAFKGSRCAEREEATGSRVKRQKALERGVRQPVQGQPSVKHALPVCPAFLTLPVSAKARTYF